MAGGGAARDALRRQARSRARDEERGDRSARPEAAGDGGARRGGSFRNALEISLRGQQRLHGVLDVLPADHGRRILCVHGGRGARGGRVEGAVLVGGGVGFMAQRRAYHAPQRHALSQSRSARCDAAFKERRQPALRAPEMRGHSRHAHPFRPRAAGAARRDGGHAGSRAGGGVGGVAGLAARGRRARFGRGDTGAGGCAGDAVRQQARGVDRQRDAMVV